MDSLLLVSELFFLLRYGRSPYILYSGNGNAYGTYLADVIAHFRSQGINISLVSAMNEPDSTFGPAPCGQEGMQVLPTQ